MLEYSSLTDRLTVFGLHRMVEVFGGRERLIGAFCVAILSRDPSASHPICFEQIDKALEWCRGQQPDSPSVEPFIREVDNWLRDQCPKGEDGKRVLFALLCEARARAEPQGEHTVWEDFVFVGLQDLAYHEVCRPFDLNLPYVDAIAQELREQGIISYDERQGRWRPNVLLHLSTPAGWFGSEVERLRQ